MVDLPFCRDRLHAWIQGFDPTISSDARIVKAEWIPGMDDLILVLVDPDRGTIELTPRYADFRAYERNIGANLCEKP